MSCTVALAVAGAGISAWALWTGFNEIGFGRLLQRDFHRTLHRSALGCGDSRLVLVRRKQRAELVKTLDELERRTSRGVAGLSDRVNRALQILREQQL